MDVIGGWVTDGYDRWMLLGDGWLMDVIGGWVTDGCDWWMGD